MSDRTMQEYSKLDFASTCKTMVDQIDEIKLGCLQRIALSLESIAKLLDPVQRAEMEKAVALDKIQAPFVAARARFRARIRPGWLADRIIFSRNWYTGHMESPEDVSRAIEEMAAYDLAAESADRLARPGTKIYAKVAAEIERAKAARGAA